MQQHVWTILVSYDRSRASLGMAAYRDQVELSRKLPICVAGRWPISERPLKVLLVPGNSIGWLYGKIV